MPSIYVYSQCVFLKVGVEPLDFWEVIGELGDGAFGKVEKVVNIQHRQKFAASKAIQVQDGEDLEDFLVEIEILMSCRHENIVSLYDCFFKDSKLTVRTSLFKETETKHAKFR